MIIYKINKFNRISEQFINDIEKIKHYLYTSEDFENYNQFVDGQSIGDCQTIVADIKRNFPNITEVFGEIGIDDTYVDEYGDEQNLITHHWIEINGTPYDFSKGTLKHYIVFDSMYDPEITPNEIDKYYVKYKK